MCLGVVRSSLLVHGRLGTGLSFGGGNNEGLLLVKTVTGAWFASIGRVIDHIFVLFVESWAVLGANRPLRILVLHKLVIGIILIRTDGVSPGR